MCFLKSIITIHNTVSLSAFPPVPPRPPPPKAFIILNRIPRATPSTVPVTAAHPNNTNSAAADTSPLGAASFDRTISRAISIRRLSEFTLQLYSSLLPSGWKAHDSVWSTVLSDVLPFFFFAEKIAEKKDLTAFKANAMTAPGVSCDTERAKVSRVALTMIARTALGGTRDCGDAETSNLRNALPDEL